MQKVLLGKYLKPLSWKKIDIFLLNSENEWTLPLHKDETSLSGIMSAGKPTVTRIRIDCMYEDRVDKTSLQFSILLYDYLIVHNNQLW